MDSLSPLLTPGCGWASLAWAGQRHWLSAPGPTPGGPPSPTPPRATSRGCPPARLDSCLLTDTGLLIVPHERMETVTVCLKVFSIHTGRPVTWFRGEAQINIP